MNARLPRRVRSYIDDVDADDGDSLTSTGSGLTLEGALPPPSRAPKLSVAASPQQHQSSNAAEPDEVELRITADGTEPADPSRTALEAEQAAEANESTKLPPIDRGYAWIIALASGLITFTFVGLFRSNSVFLEPVRAHFHVNYTEIALANSASIFWSHIGTLLGNMLNEWLGPRINCAAAGVAGLVGFLMCAFAPVFGVYFASFVFLIGSSGALAFSPAIVVIGRHFRRFRPLATSLAASGSSFGTIVIPLVLRVIREKFGLRVTFIVAGAFAASMSLVGLLFRPIDPKALVMLDAIEQKQKQSRNQNRNSEPIGSPAEEVTTSVDKSVQLQRPKGKLKNAFVMCREYFRNFPVLICNRKYLLCVTCYCGLLCANMTLIITMDSFVGSELRGEHTIATITMIGFAIGDLVGRILSGALTAIPVLFPKVTAAAQQTNNTQNEEETEVENNLTNSKQSILICIMLLFRGTFRVLKVRVIYVLSGWLLFFSMCLILCLALFSSRPPSSILPFFVYAFFGFSSGATLTQFPVVIVEIVGVIRLAAAHALFLLLSAPIVALVPLVAGVLKDMTRSWTLPYAVLAAFAFLSALVNSFNMFGVPRQLTRTCSKEYRRRANENTVNDVNE